MPTIRRTIVPLVALCGSLSAQNIITTFAGTDWIFNGDRQPALSVRFKQPVAITVDPNGNPVVADSAFGVVARINKDGTLTVLAGNGFSGDDSGDGGPATSASLSEVVSVAFDPQGNLYIGESGHIRKVTPAGIITTIAGLRNLYGVGSGEGGLATDARIYCTDGLTVDSAGNIYVGDWNNHRVWKIDESGIITTFAGNGLPDFSGEGGPATAAGLKNPNGLAFDGNGNLYIADTSNQRVLKVTPGGIISTLVYADQGSLDPHSVALDSSGTLYISGYLAVYKLSQGASAPQLIAGNPSGRGGFGGDNGPASNAILNEDGPPIMVDSHGDLFLADNYRVRKISKGVITTVAGAGFFSANHIPALDTPLLFPSGSTSTSGLVGGLAFDNFGNLFISEPDNNRVLKISPDGFLTTVAGTGARGYSGDYGPATQATLAAPSGLAVYGGNLYIADSGNGIRLVSPSGIITTFSSVPQPNGLAFDRSGNLFATCGPQICKIDSGGNFNVIAGISDGGRSGDGGPAILAGFSGPSGIAVDRDGKIYVADYWNTRVRVITPDGIIHAFAGNGYFEIGEGDNGPAIEAPLGYTSGLALDPNGNLYIAESYFSNYGRVRKVDPSTGTITTVAGGGPPDQLGDGLPAPRATLKVPVGLAFDSSANLYLADGGSNRIREIVANPPALQVAPTSVSFSAPSGSAPVTQTFAVTSSISGLEFSVSINGSGGWLSAESSVGSTPRLLTLTADPSGVPPGAYSAVVSIRPGAGGPSQSLTANFQVTAAQPPRLHLDKSEISFTLTQTGLVRSSTLVVADDGGQSLNYSATFRTTTGGNWLSVSPPSGSATPGKPSTLTLTANAGSLGPGVYTGEIAILTTVGNQSIPVILTVSQNPQAVLLTQTGLSFTAVAGGGVIPPQSFGVVNAGIGVMRWTASTSTTDGGNWLLISPASGSSDGSGTAPQIAVLVNPTGLAPGAYYGTVRVDAPATANQSRLVTVFFQVLPGGTPYAASVQPPELVFYTTPSGLAPGSQTVSVYNITRTPRSFTSGRSSEGFALYTLPPNGTLNPDVPTQVEVQPFANFDLRSAFDAGTTKGTLTFQFSDGITQSVGITVVSSTPGAAPSPSVTARPRAQDQSSCTVSQLVVKLNSLGQAFQVSVGWPVGLNVSVTDNCQNPVVSGSGSVWAHFDDGEDDVVLTSLGDGTWQGTWKPAQVNPNVTMTLNARQGALAAKRAIAGALASANDQPSFTLSSIGSAFSPPVTQIRPLAPGSFLSIYGQRLADYTADASGALPTQLGNTQVFFNRQPAPISHVDPTQINVVVPYGVNLHTSNQIRVQRGLTLSDPVAVDIADAQPSVLQANGNAFALDYPADGSAAFQVSAASPAKAADVLVMYCVGLGTTDQTVPDGGVSPGSPAANVQGVAVTIGGQNAPVSFAGLAPGFVGLYQINAVMPQGVAAGAARLSVNAGGQTSPELNLAVQ